MVMNEKTDEAPREGLPSPIGNGYGNGICKGNRKEGNARGGFDDIQARIRSAKSEKEFSAVTAEITGEKPDSQGGCFFKKVARAIGVEAYRMELDKFAAELKNGEEPRNRGAAFTARLKKAMEARP